MTFTIAPGGERLEFTPRTVVIAGFTARDRAAAQTHIDELAAQGIAAPASIPAYYPMAASALTHATTIAVAGTQTSGEVEPVLLCTARGRFIAVGSDHTDRAMERDDILASKRGCPKPISTEVWPLERLAGGALVELRCWIEGAGGRARYQSGGLASYLPIEQILTGARATGVSDDGLALFLGTVPLCTRSFVYADRYTMELSIPALGESIALTYGVTVSS